MKVGNPSKDVAEYILEKAREDRKLLTPMQVLKLAYIAHGWCLGLFGRPLVNEPVEAWQYGPVIPSIYHTYKRFGSKFITSAEPCTFHFDTDETSVMDQVWEGYGDRTGVSLSSLTHEPGTPWSLTVEQSGMGAVISNDLIEDHYSRLAAARQ